MATRPRHGLPDQLQSHLQFFCVLALSFSLISLGDGRAFAQSVITSESTQVRLNSLSGSNDVDGPVTFTVSVTTDHGGDVPGGTLQLIDETTMTVLGWADIAHSSITVDHLAPGRHVIRADYSGSADFLPALFQPARSAALSLDVLKAPEVSVASSQNPSAPGEVLTLTASVHTGTDTPRGAVTFRDGDRVLAAHVALDYAGRASFTTSALDDGPREIVAEYEGDRAHALAVSKPLMQRVGDRQIVSSTSHHRRR